MALHKQSFKRKDGITRITVEVEIGKNSKRLNNAIYDTVQGMLAGDSIVVVPREAAQFMYRGTNKVTHSPFVIVDPK